MSSTSESDESRMKRERILFVIIALVLIFNFVRRLFPVAERAGSAENMLSILMDLGMAVGLVGLGVRILKAIPREERGRGKWMVLLVAGSIAVAGILVIHARGGPRVELPPRELKVSALVPSTTRTEAVPTPGVWKSPGPEATAAGADPLRFLIVMELKNLIETADQRFQEMDDTRWAKIIQTSDVEQRRTLTHDDFREFCQKQSRYFETLDEGAGRFAEAKAKGISFAAFENDPRSNPEVLRFYHAFRDASERYYALLEANWDDYWPKGLPTSTEQAKPWQREAMQLDAEIDASLAKMKELAPKR